jgi:DNA-binding NarL/FixJ family response regulator
VGLANAASTCLGEFVVNGLDQNLAIYLMSPSLLGRSALRLLLETELNVPVVAESGFVATDVWSALRNHFAIALIDCDLPDAELLSVVEMVPRLKPRAKVLLVTGAVDPNCFAGWRSGFLDGAISKQGGIHELRTALDWACAGKRYFSAELQMVFTAAYSTASPLAKLSRRESELLPLLARGLRLQDAASEMQISYKTADSYRTSLLRKLGCRDRVELARFAIREKIIVP